MSADAGTPGGEGADAPVPGPARIAYGIGAVGLVIAMAADFSSVVARHLGHPIHGSIEVVQAAIVFAISAALIGATFAGAHAAVHVITERLPAKVRAPLARLASLLGAVFFAALCVGGLWLLSDTLPGDERTDLLHLPPAPFRLIWAAATAVTAVLFAWRVIRPLPDHAAPDHAS
ncbi:MAG: TRAP transporter small permease [Caulobacteraceae bacterium]